MQWGPSRATNMGAHSANAKKINNCQIKQKAEIFQPYSPKMFYVWKKGRIYEKFWSVQNTLSGIGQCWSFAGS